MWKMMEAWKFPGNFLHDLETWSHDFSLKRKNQWNAMPYKAQPSKRNFCTFFYKITLLRTLSETNTNIVISFSDNENKRREHDLQK